MKFSKRIFLRIFYAWGYWCIFCYIIVIEISVKCFVYRIVEHSCNNCTTGKIIKTLKGISRYLCFTEFVKQVFLEKLNKRREKKYKYNYFYFFMLWKLFVIIYCFAIRDYNVKIFEGRTNIYVKIEYKLSFFPFSEHFTNWENFGLKLQRPVFWGTWIEMLQTECVW